jgi:hypothetical protein
MCLNFVFGRLQIQARHAPFFWQAKNRTPSSEGFLKKNSIISRSMPEI